jgi:hypothetical protein
MQLPHDPRVIPSITEDARQHRGGMRQIDPIPPDPMLMHILAREHTGATGAAERRLGKYIPEQILLRSTPSNRGLKTPFPTTKQNRSWPTRIPERSRQDGSLHLCRRATVAPPSGRSGA